MESKVLSKISKDISFNRSLNKNQEDLILKEDSQVV